MLPIFSFGNTTSEAASVIVILTNNSPEIPACDKFKAADSDAVISIEIWLAVSPEPWIKLLAPSD